MTNRRSILLSAAVCVALVACSPSPVGSVDGSGSQPAEPTTSAGASPALTPDLPPSVDPTPVPTPPIPADALLPNLVMEPLAEWRVEFRNDRRLLRVTTIFSNYGVGAMELTGSRADTSQPTMSMTQIVHLSGGGTVEVPTPVRAEYAGDGHDHWHSQRVVTMELTPVLDPGTSRYGSKLDFCFFDNMRTNAAINGSPSSGFYRFAWCGEPDDLTVRMGLSLGWGDRYQWSFEYQWVDITGLAGGTYTLTATVDQPNDFLETDDTDNCTTSRIQIPAAGEGQIIVVEDNQVPCST
ncbi:MAG TPA: lysyl oxidase family protein [Candidatus Limnocylindria bacterium]|nr:lysyl oxidase family protein [Candidatus Limnocylindria bacterium]